MSRANHIKQDFVVEIPNKKFIGGPMKVGMGCCAGCKAALHVESYLQKKSIGLLSEQKNDQLV